MDTAYVSKERLAELKSELAFLKTERRLEIAERLRQAKEYGDLSENSEYSEARDEQAQVEQRIFELEELLKKAVLIKKTVATTTVIVGSTVTVKKNGKVIQYEIVGSAEAKPEEGKISNESPLGRSFLGRKTGDSITVATPAGQSVYVIVKIG
jgi:transcription elongation factor GreA